MWTREFDRLFLEFAQEIACNGDVRGGQHDRTTIIRLYNYCHYPIEAIATSICHDSSWQT